MDFLFACFTLNNSLRLNSKVVSTHLWNTPLNLYQQAIIKGFLSLLARGIAWGVLWGCVAIFLDE